MFKILVASLMLLYTLNVCGQEDNPVLFSVANDNIHVNEFSYIYNKNNNEEHKYSKESLQEYLDLYVNFKLKVRAARDIQLDTLPELKDELRGYQKQLAQSYLTDKQIKNDILLEAYERSLKDIEIAHILIKANSKSKKTDTVDSFVKIMDIKRLLDEGGKFEELAITYSEDLKTKNKGGRIGYINAVLPSGFYDLESAAYNTEVGEVSDPVRTRFGYHLIKVLSQRDARGEIEASHLLLRDAKDDSSPDSLKNKIYQIHKELTDGASWDDNVSKHSQDNTTKSKGGNLGFFGINKYEKSFEDAAFALSTDGDISPPTKSKLGWHIIRRESKREVLPFKQAKYSLDQRLKNSIRIKRAERLVIERIRTEANVKEDEEALSSVIYAVDSNFYKFDWNGFDNLASKNLLSFNDHSYVNTEDFNQYLIKHKGTRVRSKRYNNAEKAIEGLYQSFVEEQLIEYEKTQLAIKYPAFKALMREYDEGILLFEITKNEVWDRAQEDSIGLKAFFDENRDDYQWGPRAEISKYELRTDNVDLADNIKAYAMSHTYDAVLDQYGKEDLVTHTLQKMLRDKLPKGLLAEVGALSASSTNDDKTIITFYKVESLIDPQPKRLDESRGFVLAAYQQHLEKMWISELKGKYEVEINENVFDSMIK